MSKDITEIYAIHRLITAAELERANWDIKHEDIFAIGNIFGEQFDKSRCRRWQLSGLM